LFLFFWWCCILSLVVCRSIFSKWISSLIVFSIIIHFKETLER
jgi:hypothetical protein